MVESVKQLPKLKKKLLSKKQLKLNNFRVGQAGEQSACAFLTKHNYQILATNILLKKKEIDLIALDLVLDEIVFVEVKTRSNAAYGDPSQAVNWHKVNNLKQAAWQWLKQQHLAKTFRFDIISISSGKINHYKNITGNW